MAETARPLAGVKVLDLGVGMAASLAARLLVEGGADVLRLEPPASDPFYDTYPAYRVWQSGKTVETSSDERLAAALRTADICLVGGEAHPDLSWHDGPASLPHRSDATIFLVLGGGPDGLDMPAVELLAQARSGLAFRMDPARATALAFPAASYGAALYGLTAALAALWARGGTGRGATVSTSLLQGALIWCASLWAESNGAAPTAPFKTGVMSFCVHCADDVHVHITPRNPAGFEALFEILGVPTDVREALRVSGEARPNRADGDAARDQARRWRSRDFMEAMWAKGMTAEAVLAPGACWDEPQTVHNDLIRRTSDGWDHVGSPFVIESLAAGAAAAPGKAAGRTEGGPLAGVRVVDLGIFAAGPHASVVLGDLGADVIKIERPEGDPLRSLRLLFAASSRGKRSIAIDAKQPEGAEIIQRLCATAEIVHHNFRPGVSRRMGVDAETLRRVNPTVIVLESSAYGPDGPKAERPGFDGSFQAACGHEAVAGGQGNAPTYYPFLIADFGTGALGATALAMALVAQQKHGGGVAAFGSLLNSAIFLMSELVRDPSGAFVGAPVLNAERSGARPAEAIYATADGWIAVAVRGERMARAIGAALATGDRLDAPPARWGAAEAECLAAALGTRSTVDAVALLRDAGVWVEPCQADIGAIMRDPALARAGMMLSSDDPDLGEVRQIGRAFDLDGQVLPTRGRGMIDDIGGHTRGILAGAGYSADEIAHLFDARIVA